MPKNDSTKEGRKSVRIKERELTERLAEDKFVRDALNKYFGILENLDIPYFELDLKGNLTFVNDVACRRLGYRREDLLGMDFRVYFKPESIESIRRIYREIHRTGEPKTMMTVELLKNGGETVIVQLFLSLVRALSGEAIGFRGVAIDLTEKIQDEQRYRETAEKYRTILETMEEGYGEYDLKGTVTFMNDAGCRILGYDFHELIGMNYRKFHTSEVARYIRDVFSEIYKTGQPQFLLDYEAVRKDGSVRVCEMNAALLRDEAGKPKGFRILVRDVSERKRAEAEKAKVEQQLIQAQKMESVGRLAGGVAHDFNNMITVILGYAEMMHLRLPPDNPLRREIGEIEKAAIRSRDLTRQLLAFSRKAIIAPESVHLNSLIVDSQKTILRLLGEDIDLKFYPGDGLWKIKLDPSQMEHVLINLAVNARDAMVNGGKLTIETENVHLNEEYCRMHAGFIPGQYVLLGVSDEGIGMDRQTLRQIFEPFFTTKEAGKGTGLGLAMVYGIVKQNNGFINVYSEPGKGTTFKIYLPRNDEEVVAKEEKEESLTTVASGTILLVEDDDMVRDLTTEMIEAIGYKTLTAASPREALSFFEINDKPIDLMITDVVMPGMSGKELAERVKEMRPEIRVLFMSGYTTNVIAHRGVLDEGVHFIQKPFSMSDLARKIQSVIQ